MRNILLLTIPAASWENCWAQSRCKCPNNTGRKCLTPQVLCTGKLQSYPVPDPLLYFQKATSTEKVGSQLNYYPTAGEVQASLHTSFI